MMAMRPALPLWRSCGRGGSQRATVSGGEQDFVRAGGAGSRRRQGFEWQQGEAADLGVVEDGAAFDGGDGDGEIGGDAGQGGLAGGSVEAAGDVDGDGLAAVAGAP